MKRLENHKISDLEISQMILDFKFHFANENMQLDENVKNALELLSKKEEELDICQGQRTDSWLTLKKVIDRKDRIMKKITHLEQNSSKKSLQMYYSKKC